MRLFMAIVMATGSAGGAVAAGPERLTVAEWREDLRVLAETVRTEHAEPFHTISEETFAAQVAKLDERIPELTDSQIVLEMMRLVAAIADGHSFLVPYGTFYLSAYPFYGYRFEEGRYVLHARAPDEDLRGAELVRVGDTPAEEVYEAVEPYLHGDNAQTRLEHGGLGLVIGELLHFLGFAASPDETAFTFRRQDGSEETITMKAVAFPMHNMWRSQWPADADPPLYRRDAELPYWLEYLPEANTVFVKFNSVKNAEDRHLAAFSKEVIAAIDENGANHLIVDVRHNGGGNGMLLEPLIGRIEQHPRINQDGHLYVITDRETFSAAMMFVTRMERRTNARYAGEAPGGKPNHYGDNEEFVLPNSKILVRLSSLYHEESDPDDTRMEHAVDLPVPMTAAAYFTGEDPVLDAVLAEIVARAARP